MRILHISDTHSLMPRLHGMFDIIVHSGDLFPNFGKLREKEIEFQLRWLEDNLLPFKTWTQNKPFLFVPGNHDYINSLLVESVLNSNDIDAYLIKEEVFSYKNYNFYGFPYVPYINGQFNYELNIPEMEVKVDEMLDRLYITKADIIVAHAPLANVLDLTYDGFHIGSTVIANGLLYKINKEDLPGYYLCGHCHQSNGVCRVNNMLISNAATTQNIIEL
jgi:Icc-related predicted phosphoesterase